MPRFGVVVATGHEQALGPIVELARQVEAVGLDSIWTYEDYYASDAFATLGALAASTSRVRLGLAVTNPYTRHPALLAMAAATVDRYAPGRFILGLGRATPSLIQDQLGIGYGKPLTVLSETIPTLRQLWAGEAVSARLTNTALRGVRIQPPARPNIPIYLGAMGPQALTLAGRLADGVVLNAYNTVEYCRRAVGQVRQGAKAAGRDPGQIEVALQISVRITDDPSRVLNRLRPQLALNLALPGQGEVMLPATPDERERLATIRRALKIKELLDEGREPYIYALQEGDVAAATALISEEQVAETVIIGPEDYCRARLAAYEAAGVSLFVLPGVARPVEQTLAMLAGMAGRT